MTWTSKCEHTSVRVERTTAYTGGVSHDENRRAHGNICDHEMCSGCGARRKVLHNAGAEETGAWGPTADERRAIARRLRAHATALIASVSPLITGDGRSASLDAEGMVVIVGDSSTLPAGWIAAAQRARKAVCVAEHAEREAS